MKNGFSFFLIMIYWYENLSPSSSSSPEQVNGESLRKMLKSRHKIRISPSCANYYENKHLCICPFSREMHDGAKRVLMADDLETLNKMFNVMVDEI